MREFVGEVKGGRASRRKVAGIGKVRAFLIRKAAQKFRNHRIEVRVSLAVRMSPEIERHSIQLHREVRPMIEIEAAQKVLIGFPAARVLGHGHPGNHLQQFAAAQQGTGRQFSRIALPPRGTRRNPQQAARLAFHRHLRKNRRRIIGKAWLANDSDEKSSADGSMHGNSEPAGKKDRLPVQRRADAHCAGFFRNSEDAHRLGGACQFAESRKIVDSAVTWGDGSVRYGRESHEIDRTMYPVPQGHPRRRPRRPLPRLPAAPGHAIGSVTQPRRNATG